MHTNFHFPEDYIYNIKYPLHLDVNFNPTSSYLLKPHSSDIVLGARFNSFFANLNKVCRIPIETSPLLFEVFWKEYDFQSALELVSRILSAQFDQPFSADTVLVPATRYSQTQLNYNIIRYSGTL